MGTVLNDTVFKKLLDTSVPGDSHDMAAMRQARMVLMLESPKIGAGACRYRLVETDAENMIEVVGDEIRFNMWVGELPKDVLKNKLRDVLEAAIDGSPIAPVAPHMASLLEEFERKVVQITSIKDRLVADLDDQSAIQHLASFNEEMSNLVRRMKRPTLVK